MLYVNEIFYSIQGESTHQGRPCVFVRLAGCDLRCRWCDTSYAFHEGQPMSVEAVLARLRAHPCRLVEVTGGEPLLQPETPVLLRRLVDSGYEVLLETGGHRSLESVPEGVTVIMDVKCPASGEAGRNDPANLERLRPGDQIKFVIADRADYEFARGWVRRHLSGRDRVVLFSPVHGEQDPAELAAWVLADGLPVRLQLQLHKLLWPAAVRGV